MQLVQKIHRYDAWTTEEEEKLAEIVLQHISEGKSLYRACVAAASVLGRTAGACNGRWNMVVRDRYKQQVEEALRKSGGSRTTHHRGQDTAQILRSLRAQARLYMRLEEEVGRLGSVLRSMQNQIRETIKMLEEKEGEVQEEIYENKEDDEYAGN